MVNRPSAPVRSEARVLPTMETDAFAIGWLVVDCVTLPLT
jgi:hypothetical protein